MRAEYSIYEAKAKLSEIIRRVKTKREVIITERGRKVARVVPYSEGPGSLTERLADLRARGLVQEAKSTPKEAFGRLSSSKRPGALKRFLVDRD